MKITQEELAERARLTRNYIGNLERGEKSPTLDALEAIAEALGLTPSELIDTDLWHKSDIKKI
jgi:transcriptional regulator with XRE-family HTH domain